MPSPFPGMNPYLEEPQLWEEIHTQLIVDIARAIAPQLSASYRVAIEHRTYTTVTRTPIPLQPGDDEPVVDVGALLHKIYDLMNYDNWIDYTSPPQPPLRDAEAAWCVELLQATRQSER